jgi:hypothetical protein
MSNVVPLDPNLVGDGYRFDPDEVLEGAKGQEFTDLCIIGRLPNNKTIWLSSTAGFAETLLMLERAKLKLIRMGEKG